jgi:hypothetical protein
MDVDSYTSRSMHAAFTATFSIAFGNHAMDHVSIKVVLSKVTMSLVSAATTGCLFTHHADGYEKQPKAKRLEVNVIGVKMNRKRGSARQNFGHNLLSTIINLALNLSSIVGLAARTSCIGSPLPLLRSALILGQCRYLYPESQPYDSRDTKEIILHSHVGAALVCI